MKTKLESAKSAVDQARIAETKLLQEILTLHGAVAHPASQILLTAGYVNSLVEVLGVLRGIAENAIRAEEIIQRIAPESSLIDRSWVERAVDQEIDWEKIDTVRKSYGFPPMVKGPGYVEPPASPMRGVADDAVGEMRGITPGPPIVDELASFTSTGRLPSAVQRGPVDVVWVFAGTYGFYRSWCWDHGLNHLDKKKFGYPSPGLWPHWLEGFHGFRYAWGTGWQEREDLSEFKRYIETLGGVEWAPPERGEAEDVHGS